jgi:hypothetical protein
MRKTYFAKRYMLFFLTLKSAKGVKVSCGGSRFLMLCFVVGEAQSVSERACF